MGDTLLFSERSMWTMLHGVVLGGGAMMGLAAALFALVSRQPHAEAARAAPPPERALAWLLAGTAVLLWLTVLVGTYVSFPAYRSPPPDGAVELARYPRALLLSNARTAWLHAFAMEIKEHVPWVAAMLATAVAFAGLRADARLLADAGVRRAAAALVGICLTLVALVSVLGVFINKVAPLE